MTRPLTLLLLLGLWACRWRGAHGQVTDQCPGTDGRPGFKCADGTCLDPDWICDGEVQCQLPDESDEKVGCQLFPETGCKSWYGRKHVRCPGSDRCVPDLKDCEGSSSDIKDEDDGGDPANLCPDVSGQKQWRCRSGMCVGLHLTCDGVAHCDDGTDELGGCQIHPDTGCPSWNGQRHVRCGNSSRPTCTLPEFASTGDPADCRRCEGDPDAWRCDDGFCIPAARVQDGLKHCPDGSDENHDSVTYWNMIVVTLIVAMTGVLLSFLFRLIKRRRSVFDCVFCRSSRAAKLIREMEQMELMKLRDPDSPDGGDDVEAASDEELERILPMDLIDILEVGRNWEAGRKESRKCLVRPQEAMGKHLYAKVHCDPVLYKNLYRFLSYRYGTPSKLKLITMQLFRWEEEFHGQDKLEALACWRLHLGSSDVLKVMVDSTKDPSFFNRLNDVWMPFKDRCRKAIRAFLKKHLPASVIPSMLATYNLWNTAVYLVKPFIGASFYYFDILKDFIFARLIYSSIMDLTKGNFSPAEYPFEFAILVCLFAVFFINGIIGATISVYYSKDVFEMCEHSTSRLKMNFFKLLSLALSPLMPAFLLANYVFYLQRGYVKTRELQTFAGKTSRRFRTRFFQDLEKTRYRAKMHRRLYSFFRVSTAVVQSFNMIVVIVVIVVVSGRPDRKIRLVAGVTEKIADFFQIGTEPGESEKKGVSVIENLDLVRDFAIMGTILYSLLMILSALVRYLYQCKDQNLLMTGKAFLSAYFTCHIISRLTVFIALFSTAEATDKTEPVISLFPASLLGLFIFVFHFMLIFWFKHRFVPNFSSTGDAMQRFVHVLVNTMVAVPFSTWDVDQPKTTDENPECHDTGVSRSLSWPTSDPAYAKNVARLSQVPFGTQSAPPPTRAATMDMPDSPKRRHQETSFNSFTPASACGPSSKSETDLSREKPCVTGTDVSLPLRQGVDDLRSKIVAQWWKDPSRSITLEEVRDADEMTRLLDEEAVGAIFADLEGNGFVNRRGLYHPQKTKREFFWLFAFHLLFSVLALVIEVANGGAYTKSGVYFSWDVRLSSFFVGLVFLTLYYRKYHALRDLTGQGHCFDLRNYVPVVFGFRRQDPLRAAPDEHVVWENLAPPSPRGMERKEAERAAAAVASAAAENCGSPSRKNTSTIQTQTSIIDKKQSEKNNKA